MFHAEFISPIDFPKESPLKSPVTLTSLLVAAMTHATAMLATQAMLPAISAPTVQTATLTQMVLPHANRARAVAAVRIAVAVVEHPVVPVEAVVLAH